ncbi:hypothetical protein DH2020_048554 [Rehmannia glutinosa]|uniref:PPM-type phosphatase domain-containing protein n=1 Tax=Rehmannia glutinosa TaxID=99300 RepID=A0ABR0U642_REHGL
MDLDSLGQKSPAPESNYRRRNARLDLESGEEVQLLSGEGREMKTEVRRKKSELRRNRSLSESNKSAADPSSSSDGDVCTKKKRDEIQKETKLLIKSASADLVSGNDAVIGEARVAIGSACRSHGKISVVGRRREMEDAMAVELGFLKKGGKSYDFFGVYGGRRVARACRQVLHNLVAETAEEESGEDIDWEKVMTASFTKMAAEVMNGNIGGAVATTGSTAVVAVVGENEVVVATNCGGLTAVLLRGGVAVRLSDDHMTDRRDEMERIEVCGGKEVNSNGQRVLQVLATSRSIEPEVRVINRTHEEECLILASDGLWDVVPNDVACRVARKCLGDAAEAAALLARVSNGSW